MTRPSLIGPARVVLAVTLLAGCGAAEQSSQPSLEVGTPTPSAQPNATPSPRPTAEPTPIPAGELVLRITYARFGSHWTAISLVADGRLTFPSESGWKVQVLSPSGVARMRAEVVATGLFEESADYPLVPVPNQDIGCADGLGLTFGAAIELATDSGRAIVSWAQTNAPDGCYEPSAARDALNTLLARLESPHEWLPADVWQDEALRPYEPHGFRLVTVTQPQLASVGDVPDVSSVAWPLVNSLISFGEPVPPTLFAPTWTVRCGGVSPDEAELVEEALADAGARMSDSMPSGFASIALLGGPANESTVAVVLEVLPPGTTGCAQLDLGFLNCWQVDAIQPFYCAVP
jgi:hypothetical protein